MSGERSLPLFHVNILGPQGNFSGPNLTATREVYCEMNEEKYSWDNLMEPSLYSCSERQEKSI